jgi:predicted DNA-binding transcriptional regulator AlpA
MPGVKDHEKDRATLIDLYERLVVDIHGVRDITGLGRSSVYVYSGRDRPSVPAPIAELSTTGCTRWWRADWEAWQASR